MGKYFGTDGARGVANENLSVAMAFKIGEYLGYTFKGQNIIIGSDTRLSKDMFLSALCAGITSRGANAYTTGVISTPGISYLTKNKDFKAGIMISASHNPYYDNGIKCFNQEGEKIDSDLESKLEAYIDNQIDLGPTSRDYIGRVIDYKDAVNEYLDYVASTINEDLSGFNVLLDTANGSASKLAGQLFSKLNIKTTIINNQPNGENINVDCGSTHLNQISNTIKNAKGQYDLGLAFDGDADRVLAVDSEGNTIDGDVIMFICASYLKDKNLLHKDTLVTTVMSNIGLYKALDDKGIKYEKTAVGDKYVYECLKNEGLSLGGEQSGHIIFNDYANTGDGMLSGLQLIQALKYFNASLKDMASQVTIYPQLLENVKVVDKDVVLNSDILNNEVKAIEEELHGNGRVLLRPSGTEPLIRVMVEASTQEECQKYVKRMVDIIHTLK